jgi:hypothetical protein
MVEEVGELGRDPKRMFKRSGNLMSEAQGKCQTRDLAVDVIEESEKRWDLLRSQIDNGLFEVIPKASMFKKPIFWFCGEPAYLKWTWRVDGKHGTTQRRVDTVGSKTMQLSGSK